jgi:hypothetical protein
MSFLDNLESNLKTLESQEDHAASRESQHKERERQRAAAESVAPFAEELKRGAYTAELLRQAARVGHEFRTKISVVWLGTTLRLEARARRLELRPTATSIQSVYIEDGAELRTEPLDTKASPETLLRQWLAANAAKAE